MKQLVIDIKKNVFYLFGAIILAIFSAVHWFVPLLLSVIGISVAYLYIFPESVLAIFLYGRPLIKGLFFTPRDSIVVAVSILVLVITTIGIWAKYKSFHFKITLFHISTIFLVIWTLMCLLWSPHPVDALKRLSIWILVIMVPMFIAYILVLRGMKINSLINQIIIFGAIMIVISIISELTGMHIAFDRFSPVSNKILYSRSMGFLFLSSVWLFDKKHYANRLSIIILGLFSLYFLISSATRAPFLIALFIASIYILFISKLNIKTKIVIIIAFFSFSYIFLSGSFLLLRIFSVSRGIEASASIRTIVWSSALRHLFEIPIYGVGIGGFAQYLPQYLKYLIQPHSNILGYYYETGIFGLLIFLSLMTIIPYKAMKLYKKYFKDKSNYFYFLEFSLIFWSYGILNNLINDSFNGGTYEWISLGIMYGLIQLENNRRQRQSRYGR